MSCLHAVFPSAFSCPVSIQLSRPHSDVLFPCRHLIFRFLFLFPDWRLSEGKRRWPVQGKLSPVLGAPSRLLAQACPCSPVPLSPGFPHSQPTNSGFPPFPTYKQRVFLIPNLQTRVFLIPNLQTAKDRTMSTQQGRQTSGVIICTGGAGYGSSRLSILQPPLAVTGTPRPCGDTWLRAVNHLSGFSQ